MDKWKKYLCVGVIESGPWTNRGPEKNQGVKKMSNEAYTTKRLLQIKQEVQDLQSKVWNLEITTGPSDGPHLYVYTVDGEVHDMATVEEDDSQRDAYLYYILTCDKLADEETLVSLQTNTAQLQASSWLQDYASMKPRKLTSHHLRDLRIMLNGWYETLDDPAAGWWVHYTPDSRLPLAEAIKYRDDHRHVYEDCGNDMDALTFRDAVEHLAGSNMYHLRLADRSALYQQIRSAGYDVDDDHYDHFRDTVRHLWLELDASARRRDAFQFSRSIHQDA